MIVADHQLVGSFKREMEEVFGLSIEKIHVCILTSDEFACFKDYDWVVGCAFPRKKTVFVLEEASCGRSHEEWLKIVKHEIVHVFYELKCHSSEPRWLFEGLATYCSGQKKKQCDIDIATLLKYHATSDAGIYEVGYSAVKKLLE